MTDEVAREKLLEKERCPVCGLVHPFLQVCPFVEEREVRYEFALDGAGRRRARFKVERIKYFPRPQLIEALEQLTEGGAKPSKPRRRPRK